MENDRQTLYTVSMHYKNFLYGFEQVRTMILQKGWFVRFNGVETSFSSSTHFSKKEMFTDFTNSSTCIDTLKCILSYPSRL